MIDFLSIGHCCLDKKDNNWVPGGATSYGLRLATQLSIPAALFTSIAPDFDVRKIGSFKSINVKSDVTTKFENQETEQGRIQHISAIAKQLQPIDFAGKFSQVPLVHICPIIQEVDWDFLDYFPKDTLICLSPQGWLRSWDEDGKISHLNLPDWSKWKRANIVVVSEEDITDIREVEEIATLFDYFILTKGANGAKLFYENQVLSFPVFQVDYIVDTTGAGDVFAAAFSIKLLESKDPILSMQFATVAASFCIQAENITFELSHEKMENRLRKYQSNDYNP